MEDIGFKKNSGFIQHGCIAKSGMDARFMQDFPPLISERAKKILFAVAPSAMVAEGSLIAQFMRVAFPQGTTVHIAAEVVQIGGGGDACLMRPPLMVGSQIVPQALYAPAIGKEEESDLFVGVAVFLDMLNPHVMYYACGAASLQVIREKGLAAW